jgi:adenylate cyclase
MSKKLVRGLAVGGAVFLVAILFHSLGVFEPLEWKSWDLRLRLFSSASRADRDIVLILIDQESLDVYEKSQSLPWPWPRQMYAAFLDYLKAGGAKAVFFDLILSEGSRYGVEDDETLAAAMRSSGNVFIPFFLSDEAKDRDEAAIRELARFALPPSSVPGGAAEPLRSASLPIEVILRAAAGSGNVRFAPDGDGIFRRIPLAFAYEGLVLPSLPLAMKEFVKVKARPEDIPLDGRGRMIVRFHGPTGTYRTWSAAAVINSWAQMEEGKAPQIDPREFSGKTVLFGTSAPGLLDLRPTPFSAVGPGTEIQAAALDNLLNGDFVRVPRGAAALLYILVLSLLPAVAVSFANKTWKAASLFALFTGLPAAASSLAFAAGTWLPFAVPVFAALLASIGASLLNYGVEGRQRRFIKSVFRHYLSPDVIERILENPALLALGGEKREISALFSDVAGFTSVSEKLPPEELVELLNAYLSEMTDIILATGGTLDKYEGDAIIAFWNAPLDQPDHALRACRAALKCQKRLEELRPEFARRFGSDIFARIGLHSGPAVVGNMGSRKRFDYTAMGDTMNLASRLEGACKQYKIFLLISEETRESVKGAILTREIDMIRVMGKKRPVRVFEPVGEREGLAESVLEKTSVFERGLAAYRARDWDGAAVLFGGLPDDPPSAIYLRRCAAFRESPPPADWDGVYELREK